MSLPVDSAEPNMARQRVVVGACTYNEATNIRELLTRITTAVPHADVIVIDDNSPDGTADQVRAFRDDPSRSPWAASEDMDIGGDRDIGGNVDVLVRHEQRGLGGAILAAMQHAIDQRYDWFINLDADLSHDPAAIPRMLDIVAHDRSIDVVVGSRYVPGGRIVGWPPHRRWMSRLINGFTRRLLRLPVRDASGSFRCYRVACLERTLQQRADSTTDPSQGYAFLQEVLLDLHWSGARCTELPITFTDRVAGDSKLNFREALRSASTVVRLLTRRPPRSS